MAKKVKCQHCGEYEEKELMSVRITGNKTKVNKYYHPECLEEYELHANEYKALVEFICDLFKIKAPTIPMVNQIKSFHKEHEMRYFAIQLALEYFFIVKGNKLPDNKTLGIVPYVIEDAKKYYYALAETEGQNDLVVRHMTTKIKSPTKKNRKNKLINITEL